MQSFVWNVITHLCNICAYFYSALTEMLPIKYKTYFHFSYLISAEYVIHMLTYLDGVPLTEMKLNFETRFCLGQMVGHIRNTLKVSCQGNSCYYHNMIGV